MRKTSAGDWLTIQGPSSGGPGKEVGATSMPGVSAESRLARKCQAKDTGEFIACIELPRSNWERKVRHLKMVDKLGVYHSRATRKTKTERER